MSYPRMLKQDLIMCWHDEAAEAEDFMELMLKQKNYIGLRVYLDKYFKAKAKIEAGEQLAATFSDEHTDRMLREFVS